MRERFSDVHIDPTFPEPAPASPAQLPVWVSESGTDEQWIRAGEIDVPTDFLRPRELGPSKGPWLAVAGSVHQERGGRRAFGIVLGLLVRAADEERLLTRLSRGGHPGNDLLDDHPADHYTFAGEIPWHSDFAPWSRDEMYIRDLGRGEARSLKVETLAHGYSWESYHSPLNRAGGELVPSRNIAEKFDMRGMPQTFDMALPDGSLASRSLAGPDGFTGRLLYLREDLVRVYAGRRRFAWFVWGEREVTGYGLGEVPPWLRRTYDDEAYVWRLIRSLDEVASSRPPAPRKTPKPAKRSGRATGSKTRRGTR